MEAEGSLLEYFESLQLRPGAWLKIVSRNYDGTLSLQLEPGSVTLGTTAAQRIWVAPAPKSR